MSGNVVGIALPKATSRWDKDCEYLTKNLEGYGFEVRIVRLERDAEMQIKDIESLLNYGINYLIVSPVSNDGLERVLKKAVKNGVKIVSYDELVSGIDDVACYVSFNNYEIGKIQMEYIIKELRLGCCMKYANIELVAGGAKTSVSPLAKGAYDVLEKYLNSGKIKVLSGQTTFEETTVEDWSTKKAEERVENLIKNYYSDGEVLDAIYCANDTIALGALNAIRSSYKGKNVVITTGQDCENLNNIMDRTQTMTVFKDLRIEAEITALAINKLHKGEKLDETLLNELDPKFKCRYCFNDEANSIKNVPSFLLYSLVVVDGKKFRPCE